MSRVSMHETISEDEVHVWTVRPEPFDPARARAEFEGLMNDTERTRYRRFVFDRHRHDFLVARALVRCTLGGYLGVLPEELRFEIGEHGKPELDSDFDTDLRFNLSHTRGLIAIGVTRRHDLGVDVESTVRKAETVRLADRYFSPLEVRDLRALPTLEQRERFFVYWTLKESYIKARGLGLAIPLDRFSFVVRAGEAIRIGFDPRLEDDPRCWQFLEREYGEEHRLAVAVRRGLRGDVAVRVRESGLTAPD